MATRPLVKMGRGSYYSKDFGLLDQLTFRHFAALLSSPYGGGHYGPSGGSEPKLGTRDQQAAYTALASRGRCPGPSLIPARIPARTDTKTNHKNRPRLYHFYTLVDLIREL